MANPVDLIELLEQEHRRIDQLAERLDSVDDAAEVRDLYLQIVDAVLAHEAVEHQVLYPAYRQMLIASGGESSIDARLGEHEELDGLLEEMRELDCNGMAFIKRGSALLLELEGHFAREEESVFAPMREHLPADELVRLGKRAMSLRTSTAS